MGTLGSGLSFFEAWTHLMLVGFGRSKRSSEWTTGWPGSGLVTGPRLANFFLEVAGLRRGRVGGGRKI
ncbi:unnamed protein product [Calypogeia fissa]